MISIQFLKDLEGKKPPYILRRQFKKKNMRSQYILFKSQKTHRQNLKEIFIGTQVKIIFCSFEILLKVLQLYNDICIFSYIFWF